MSVSPIVGEPYAGARTMCVGLVAAPELPAQIAVDLTEELPELLSDDHDDRWRVTLAEEPLLAGREGVEEILDAGSQARSEEGWDAAICLTDVPLRDGTRPLVAAVDRHDKVAVVNIPGFGATLLKPRVRRAVVALIGDIARETLERSTKVRPPLRRETAPHARANVRYLLPAGLGHLRLLSGMVRANRPWRAFSGLSSAVVAAFGTGAYALLSTSIWQLSGQLGWPRLGAIMVCAVTAMVAWLIIGHDLWEKTENGRRPKDAALYNAATGLTLGVAVLCGYAAMFVLLFGVGALLIEGGVFKDNAGHAAGIGAYAALAWLGAAIGTVAGALGTKLENIDEVRHATYGHNQCRRREPRGSAR
jgi:hypothetical protein